MTPKSPFIPVLDFCGAQTDELSVSNKIAQYLQRLQDAADALAEIAEEITEIS